MEVSLSLSSGAPRDNKEIGASLKEIPKDSVDAVFDVLGKVTKGKVTLVSAGLVYV